MKPLFDPSGGIRKTDAFTFVSIIQNETWHFCEAFLTYKNDPKGRLFDQMTQAARSGRANLLEGSARASTSKKTEMELTDVARASLAELLNDYECWLVNHGRLPWTIDEGQPVFDVRLDPPNFGRDLLHDSCLHTLEQRKKFARWLDSCDSMVIANCMLVLLQRVLRMLKRIKESQGEAFVENGGFNERLMDHRLDARDAQRGLPGSSAGTTPVCPECGKPMRLRKPRSGGLPFWGCSGFPECRGTREAGESPPGEQTRAPEAPEVGAPNRRESTGFDGSRR